MCPGPSSIEIESPTTLQGKRLGQDGVAQVCSLRLDTAVLAQAVAPRAAYH